MFTKSSVKLCAAKQFFRSYSSPAKQNPAEYCLHLVRANDYENFLCTLLLPSEIKSAAFAVRALNVEVALVEDRISDKQIGLMRLKFWDTLIENSYRNKPSQTPVSLELHRVLKKHSLSKNYLKSLVQARIEKLSTSTFKDLESVEKYCEDSVSSVYRLLLEAQRVSDANAERFADCLGKAHGIMNLIRSVRYNARKRVAVLPENVLLKHNVSSEAIFREKKSPEFKAAISEVASRAKTHLDEASTMRRKIKREDRILFLPFHIVRKHLENLEKVDFDIDHQSFTRRNNLLPLQLYWKKLIKA